MDGCTIDKGALESRDIVGLKTFFLKEKRVLRERTPLLPEHVLFLSPFAYKAASSSFQVLSRFQ